MLGIKNQLNWRAIFNTLLAPAIQDKQLKYNVTTSNNQIILATSDNAQAKKSLITAFNTFPHFFPESAYEMLAAHGPLPPKDIEIEGNLQDPDRLQLKTMFKALSSGLENLLIHFEDGIIHSPWLAENKFDEIISTIKTNINKASISDLKNLWKGLEIDFNHLDKRTFELNNIFNECFSKIEHKQSGSYALCFNMRLFSHFIGSPKILTDANSNLILGRRRFQNYLRRLTQDGPLVRVFKTKDDKIYAKPLFFAKEKLETNHVTFMIDASVNMKTKLHSLAKNILAFSETLKKSDPQATLEILFFNDSARTSKTFSVTDTPEISAFLFGNAANALGKANLCEALTNQLDELLKAKTNQENNAAIVLISGSSEPNLATEQIFDKLDDFKQAGLKLPKLLTMGYQDCNPEVLGSLAFKTASHFIDLKNSQDFNKINDYLSFFLHEPISVEMRTESLTLSSTLLAGDIQSHDTLIPLNQNEELVFTVGDAAFAIQVPDKDKVPLANSDDLLQIAIMKAEMIMASSHDLQDKINKLNSLEEKFLRDNSSDLLPQVKLVIDDFCNRLIRAETRTGTISHENLKRHAQISLGISEPSHDAKPATLMLDSPDRSLPPSSQHCFQAEEYMLHCQSEQGDAFVFPKMSSSTELGPVYDSVPQYITGDEYDESTCYPIVWQGKPSAVCDGKQTRAIFSPKQENSPLGSLGLLAILYHGVRNLFSQKEADIDPASTPIRKQAFENEMARLMQMLIEAEERIEKYKDEKDTTLGFTYNDLLDFKNRVISLIEKFKSGEVSKEQVRELRDEIQYFTKDIKCDFSSTQKISDNQIFSTNKPFTCAYPDVVKSVERAALPNPAPVPAKLSPK